jgi:hypothetical protein
VFWDKESFKIYVVFHKTDNYNDCDCIHTEVTLVTTDVNKVIEFAVERNTPCKVELWKNGEYIGEIDESHFERPLKELKDILLKGGV